MKSGLINKKSELQRMWKCTGKPNKLDWALVFIVLFCVTMIFVYGDIFVTIEHSFNFIDSFFQGSMRDFYQVALENSSYGHPAVYDIPLYIMFAIWNFPVYLLHKYAGVTLTSFPCLVWAKLLLIVFVLLTVIVIFSIALELGMTRERAKWVIFIFLTSSTLVIPVFIISQYDIISVFFALLGVRAFIRKDEKWFIIWFLVANTMKLFSLFIFIPLLLFGEKKIFSICWKAILGVLGIILSKAIYFGDVAYQASTQSFSQDMILRLQGTGINWNGGNFSIPLFLLFLFLICIFSYVKVCNDKERGVFAIYIPMVVFLAFSVLTSINPYWLVLMAPYMSLMVFITPGHLKVNILLETVIGIICTIFVSISSPGVFSQYTMQTMLVSKLLPIENYARRFYSLSDLYSLIHLQNYGGILLAILFACVITFFVLNYPRIQNMTATYINGELVERSIVWFHAAVPCIIALLLCIIYVVPAPHVVLNDTEGETVNSAVNILKSGEEVTQEMVFEEDLEIKMIEVGYSIENLTWIDTSSIWFTITDDVTKDIIYEKRKAANSIMDGTVRYNCDGLKLKKDHLYTIKIYGQDGEENPVYVKLVKGKNQYKTYEGYRLLNGDICMKIYL